MLIHTSYMLLLTVSGFVRRDHNPKEKAPLMARIGHVAESHKPSSKYEMKVPSN
jgi:hypothetical protein